MQPRSVLEKTKFHFGLRQPSAAFMMQCLLCIFFQGCLVQEPEWKPENSGILPNRWVKSSNGQSAKVKDGWIQDFQDSDLDKLIKEAIENNPTLKAAESRLEASRQGTLLSNATPATLQSPNPEAKSAIPMAPGIHGKTAPIQALGSVRLGKWMYGEGSAITTKLYWRITKHRKRI